MTNMPVTPSPHRFLPGRQQSLPPQKERPTPLPRTAQSEYEATSRAASTQQRTTQALGSAQFAQTPRFGFGRPPATPARQASPPDIGRAAALRAAARCNDGIEEAIVPHDDGDGDYHDDEKNEDDEMLDCSEQAEAIPTTEVTQQQSGDRSWTGLLPHSPKRRRVDGPPGEGFISSIQSPVKPLFKRPTTLASAPATRSYRFARAGSVASSVNDDMPAIRRPAFLRSSVAPLEQHEPLPEAFSPHRRGEKYVAGGMAATMQQWVIETGQRAAHSRKGYLNGADYVLRTKVDNVQGSRPLLAEGTLSHGVVTRLLLMVDSKKDPIELEPGSIVGIRAPTWDVELNGVTWSVGVDWKILQD